MNNEPGAGLVARDEQKTLATQSELEERRRLVIKLRLQRYSQRQIQGALAAVGIHVDQSTVSRDLHWVAENREALFGPQPKFVVEEEIGEALDLFQDVESSALRDYARCEKDDIKGKSACLRTAVLARSQRLSFLQDLGFLERQLGTVGVTLRADQLRTALREEGFLLTGGQVIDAESVTGDDADDAVMKWLNGEK